MKISPLKIVLGLAGATGIVFLLSSFKSSKKDATPANSGASLSSTTKATASQFDDLVDAANQRKSDWFQGASTDELNRQRATFMSNLSTQEADILIGLVKKDEKDWKASDKLNFDFFLKKWKKTLTPVSTIPVAPKPPVSSTSTNDTTAIPVSSNTVYDPTKDVDYSKKVVILQKWYDFAVATNKKRLIPRLTPSKNSFMTRFLPWSVPDLNAYTALVYIGEKNRDVRDNDIMTDLKKKYPSSFRGNDTFYSFTGSPVMLSNKTNWNF